MAPSYRTPPTVLERVVTLETNYDNIKSDLEEIKDDIKDLVSLAGIAKGRSEANGRLLRGLSPALWTAVVGGALSALAYLVIHAQALPIKIP